MSSLPRSVFERATWRKSTRSGTGNDTCVELADLQVANLVGVRDSVDPQGPALAIARRELAALVGRINRGELDL